MLLKRSSQKEMMDDFSVADTRVYSALAELKIINEFLGGNSVTKNGFEEFCGRTNRNMPYTVLDAGSGSSDILIKLKNSFKSIIIYAFDKNMKICLYSKINNNILNIICGDILKLPFKDEYFDIVHASLFLHHFSMNEIQNILVNLLKISRRGIIINELRRNIFALLGIKFLTLVFSKNQLVKNDAPLSVKKGFKKKELQQILMNLQATEYLIKRKWAFRWLIVIFK
jgi:ubiquinone/menaquinone biosynthesis C-methylase UbiE